MTKSVIVKSRIYDFTVLDGRKLEVDGSFAPALAEKVKNLIIEACKRARANGRNTVMDRDL